MKKIKKYLNQIKFISHQDELSKALNHIRNISALTVSNIDSDEASDLYLKLLSKNLVDTVTSVSLAFHMNNIETIREMHTNSESMRASIENSMSKQIGNLI